VNETKIAGIRFKPPICLATAGFVADQAVCTSPNTEIAYIVPKKTIAAMIMSNISTSYYPLLREPRKPPTTPSGG
jgi:hypothetical protein